jgi:hypothetical protein
MPAVVIIAIVVLVLGAAAALFAVQRGRDTHRAVGFLDRETKSRDRAGRKDVEAPADAPVPSSGREVELATAQERAGTDLVPA